MMKAVVAGGGGGVDGMPARDGNVERCAVCSENRYAGLSSRVHTLLIRQAKAGILQVYGLGMLLAVSTVAAALPDGTCFLASLVDWRVAPRGQM